ncbi:Oidioi.mRNA.OKI2018_I69.XSR.g13617.t1.cds [Oikopleura dioica]|uniref:Oidioi.mRNA.OKI2018_I69.XSR.g13617.t1.cds n=1 Tax=Oikopleura dioica TaxID=34765 RepID=A0ABN7S936_OIKDI|nr:Oidioi.mRNA.OKI2018_I69.XSR.g13617.t1.cds [Oikopleura dioica]
MIPLISLTGLWQLPVFFGARQPHECVDGKPVMLPLNDTDCAMENTYLTEFELYCDKADIGPWLQSAANLGGMAGHMLWGLCQDAFGRRKTYIVTGFLTFAFALSIVFVKDHVTFIILRALFGVAANGMGSYTLPLELVSSEKRWIVGLFMGTGWGLGTFWHLFSVWANKDWRYAMVIQILPLGVVIFYVWWLPESPRWLVQKGRRDDAIIVLKDMASVNGHNIDVEIDTLENLEGEYEKKKQTRFNFMKMFDSTIILQRFAMVSFIHLVGTTLWYTIILSVASIGTCVFTTYFIFGIIEGPLSRGIVLKYARRKGIAAGIGGAAFFMFISQMVKMKSDELNFDQDTLAIVVLSTGLIAKCLSTFYWPFIETYNSEITPTVIRDSVFGLTSTIAGFGGFLVPFLLDKFGETHSEAAKTEILAQACANEERSYEAIRHCKAASMDTQASKTEFVLKIVEKLEKNHLKLANDFKSSDDPIKNAETKLSENDTEENIDSGLNFTIESGEELNSQASVASRHSLDGFVTKSTSISSIADSGLGTRSTFSMKRMKRMASDSKILIDKTFRRKISEKKIQLLEQNLEQDELDAKVIETSDANRRNVELEVDVQRLSNELNLAIKRCEKLELELTDASQQLKFAKEGVMAKSDEAFVKVIQKLESALNKINESIVYSNYPGYDVNRTLDDIAAILDEAMKRSKFLIVRENSLASILSKESEFILRQYFKQNCLDLETMSEKEKMEQLLKALPELTLSEKIARKSDFCVSMKSLPLQSSTPFDSESELNSTTPPPKPPRTLRKMLAPGSSHSLSFAQNSLEYLVPATSKSKSLTRTLRRKIVKLKPSFEKLSPRK